jgi:hypothetical protein
MKERESCQVHVHDRKLSMHIMHLTGFLIWLPSFGGYETAAGAIELQNTSCF